MEELENKTVQEETEYHVNFDEYDKKMQGLAEKEDKEMEDGIDD